MNLQEVYFQETGKNAKDKTGHTSWLNNDYVKWLESKAEKLPISDVMANAIQVAKDLAEWSNKYPRGRIYGMNRKDDMDGQLIKLEEKAKELLPHLP